LILVGHHLFVASVSGVVKIFFIKEMEFVEISTTNHPRTHLHILKKQNLSALLGAQAVWI